MNTLIEEKDGMIIEWDVPIPMSDGLIMRADVFRPPQPGKYPVILTYGPYAKGLPFEVGYKTAWHRMITAYPEVAQGTSNKYQSWELVDPEKWVPDGYVCLRIDSRGAGNSEGFLDVWCAQEAHDQFECIDLTDNDIVKLEELPGLQRLESLMLANNRVQKVDEKFGLLCPKLTTLILTNNRIGKLSDIDAIALGCP